MSSRAKVLALCFKPSSFFFKGKMDKINRIQNAAARLVCCESKYCHITPILYNLHWLPVKYRILFVFKSIQQLLPMYICYLAKLSEYSYSLRSSCQFKLHVPRCKSSNKFGERAFMVAAPQLWNQLPGHNITGQDTMSGFKRQLKTFLFNKAFNE